MQSFFKKLPRYSLRLLLAYLVYIFTGGVLAYLLPRQARNLPQTDSFYGIGRGPDRAVLVEEPQDAFARRVEVIRTAQSTLDVCYHCVKSGETTECFFRRTVEGGRPRRARTRSAGRHCGRPFRRAE